MSKPVAAATAAERPRFSRPGSRASATSPSWSVDGVRHPRDAAQHRAALRAPVRRADRARRSRDARARRDPAQRRRDPPRSAPTACGSSMARRWAARGVPSLRLDLEGLGDADGDAIALRRCRGALRPGARRPGAQRDRRAGGSQGIAQRFAARRACARARTGRSTVRCEDERVVAAFMLNPRTLFWDATLENVRYVRRGLLQPSSWRMVLRGDVRLSRIGQSRPRRATVAVRQRWRRWRSQGERR